jgi:hypothetical protein
MMKKTIFLSIALAVSGTIVSCSNDQKSTSPSDKKSEKADVNSAPEKSTKEEWSLKRKILDELKGSHTLQSISGFMGANTMVDYFIEKGKWTASGSSIEQAMRVPYDIDLTSQDLQKLKSMKVEVSEDLTVSLLCNNKVYIKVPFKEEGFTYLLKNAPKNYTQSHILPPTLQAKSTIENKVLFLFAKDVIPETEISPIDIAQVSADAMVLKYNTAEKQFELNLFYGACCDESTYIFK